VSVCTIRLVHREREKSVTNHSLDWPVATFIFFFVLFSPLTGLGLVVDSFVFFYYVYDCIPFGFALSSRMSRKTLNIHVRMRERERENPTYNGVTSREREREAVLNVLVGMDMCAYFFRFLWPYLARE
jgi:hypothetical protein